jgi:hypothetical protein
MPALGGRPRDDRIAVVSILGRHALARLQVMEDVGDKKK